MYSSSQKGAGRKKDRKQSTGVEGVTEGAGGD